VALLCHKQGGAPRQGGDAQSATRYLAVMKLADFTTPGVTEVNLIITRVVPRLFFIITAVYQLNNSSAISDLPFFS